MGSIGASGPTNERDASGEPREIDDAISPLGRPRTEDRSEMQVRARARALNPSAPTRIGDPRLVGCSHWFLLRLLSWQTWVDLIIAAIPVLRRVAGLQTSFPIFASAETTLLTDTALYLFVEINRVTLCCCLMTTMIHQCLLSFFPSFARVRRER